jgi:hypothetical protein
VAPVFLRCEKFGAFCAAKIGAYGRSTDAVVNRMELAMPPKVNVDMAKGFSAYMLKAVLDGRGMDLVELAVTNVRR